MKAIYYETTLLVIMGFTIPFKADLERRNSAQDGAIIHITIPKK